MELLDFSKDEIQKRIDLCRERMKESGFSGMLLSAESNLNYYADYKTHAPWTTFTRPSFLFMPENGSPLLYVQTFVEPEATEIPIKLPLQKNSQRQYCVKNILVAAS